MEGAIPLGGVAGTQGRESPLRISEKPGQRLPASGAPRGPGEVEVCVAREGGHRMQTGQMVMSGGPLSLGAS